MEKLTKKDAVVPKCARQPTASALRLCRCCLSTYLCTSLPCYL